MDTRAARPFSFSFNTSDYRILLMDQDQGRLYLGSREYLVALDMHNVNKEPLIVRKNSLLFLKSSLLFGMWHLVCNMQWSLIIQYFRVSAFLNPPPPPPKKTDPLASICQEKGGMSDDRKRKTGGIIVYIRLFQIIWYFFFQDGTMTTMMFKFHLSCFSLFRVNVPTLCGW